MTSDRDHDVSTPEKWRQFEGPLLAVDPFLSKLARGWRAKLSKNHHDEWPERSVTWKSSGISRLIQIWPEAVSGNLRFKLWIAASQDRIRGRYWRQELLNTELELPICEEELGRIYEEAYARVSSFQRGDLELALYWGGAPSQSPSLLNQEIALAGWDYASEQLPRAVYGTVVSERDDMSCVLTLEEPLARPGGTVSRLVIAPRHEGYPLAGIIPGFLGKLLIFHTPFPRLFMPLIAVNVSTEGGDFFAVACICLKSVYRRMRS